MNKAGKKLKSQRGASLMLALLLFLVCAVLGSAILVAGTAAAGRLSQLSKMEQRYYAVSSAANLVREKLCDGNGTAITCVKSGEAGTLQDDTGDLFLRQLALYATIGNVDVKNPPRPLTPTQWKCFLGEEDSANPFTGFSKSFTLSVDGNDSLGVKVDATVQADRTVILEFTNSEDTENEKYTLSMVLTPEMKRSQTKTVNAGDPTQTDIKETITVKWHASSVITGAFQET